MPVFLLMDCGWKGSVIKYRALSGSPDENVSNWDPGLLRLLADCGCREAGAMHRALSGPLGAQMEIILFATYASRPAQHSSLAKTEGGGWSLSRSLGVQTKVSSKGSICQWGWDGLEVCYRAISESTDWLNLPSLPSQAPALSQEGQKLNRKCLLDPQLGPMSECLLLDAWVGVTPRGPLVYGICWL